MSSESSFRFPIAFSDIFFLAATNKSFRYSELTDRSESESEADSFSSEAESLESGSEELEEASGEFTVVSSVASRL